MHFNLILGACLASLQIVAANTPLHPKIHEKTVWVTKIVKVHPSGEPHLTNSWDLKHKAQHHAKNDPNHPHEDHKPMHHGSKKEHETEHHVLEKVHETKHHEASHHAEPKQTHHAKSHEGKHSEKHVAESKHHRAQESAPTYGSGGQPPKYQHQVLHNHNVHRANHSAPGVKWSDFLAATAQQIAAGCVFQHVMGLNGGGYGQNIAAGTPPAAVSRVISDQFYNGEINNFDNQYGVQNPTGFESWGHFSQLVWKNTAQVGCATQYCPGGVGNTGSNVPPYFTVCNYSPPGNVGGEYAQNILPPLGHPTFRGHS